MWDIVVPAAVAIAVAVIAQTVFFDPTSRRVRRLKAYLEVKESLDDSAHLADIDVLIAREISTELRSRTAGRRVAASRIRLIIWMTVFVGVAIAVPLIVRYFSGQIVIATMVLSIIATVPIAIDYLRSRNEYIAQKGLIDETLLIDAYAQTSLVDRGLDPEYELSGGHSQLLLRDKQSEIAEVVVAKSSHDLEPEQLRSKRLWAQRKYPSAEFILITRDRPELEYVLQLKRLGVASAYLDHHKFTRVPV